MNIADNYSYYCPSDDMPDNWMDLIEQKADFDTACKRLNWDERRLVLDVNTVRTRERNQIFRKMSKILNGEL